MYKSDDYKVRQGALTLGLAARKVDATPLLGGVASPVTRALEGLRFTTESPRMKARAFKLASRALQ